MDPKEQLIELIKAKMPFGKYKDRYLLELPEPYLVWFSKNGFPKGKLGDQLQIMHEIKINGTEIELRAILDAVKKGLL
jgi:uncharacterized protein (DUF3820 family)